jgi:hypothetical protein
MVLSVPAKGFGATRRCSAVESPKCERAGDVNTLQQGLDEVTAKLPALFLQKLIDKKLKEQGITPPKGLSEKMAAHFLAGNTEPFTFNSRGLPQNIKLTFTDADADELEKAAEDFCTITLPQILPEVARKSARSVLKTLRERWPEEHALQEQDLNGFRERLHERWGPAIGQLRMVLTMSREWCQEAQQREDARKRRKPKQLRRLLIRLLVRACQVTDEIVCLLENGFADGAMARWRTLHEIAVVATVISQHGESIAERYLAHQFVESKRGMDKYLGCYKQLGFRRLPLREQKKTQRNYDKVVGKYGKPFATDYGWAAFHLNSKRPTFADLEAAAGRAEMRSHYQMGNDNIHAGIKSIFVRLGLMDYQLFLAGRSNAGFTEPGQNAAITLTRLTVLVCMLEPSFDDLVAGEMMVTLGEEIPRLFAKADRRLQRDEKALWPEGRRLD